MASSQSLHGAWSLRSWEIRLPDGTATDPIGTDPAGLLTYDDAGRMTVQVMRAHRRLSVSPDPFAAAPDEVVEAWMGFISYAGRYTVDPESRTVIHHIEICSFPNWVGTDQKRLYTFEGKLLVLSTPPISLGGESAVSVLYWEPA